MLLILGCEMIERGGGLINKLVGAKYGSRSIIVLKTMGALIMCVEFSNVGHKMSCVLKKLGLQLLIFII